MKSASADRPAAPNNPIQLRLLLADPDDAHRPQREVAEFKTHRRTARRSRESRISTTRPVLVATEADHQVAPTCLRAGASSSGRCGSSYAPVREDPTRSAWKPLGETRRSVVSSRRYRRPEREECVSARPLRRRARRPRCGGSRVVVRYRSGAVGSHPSRDNGPRCRIHRHTREMSVGASHLDAACRDRRGS